MILNVDNTKNIEQAKMTPKIINLLNEMAVAYYIVSKKKDLLKLIETKMYGLLRESNPRPPAPETRIIPLDQAALL